MPDESPAGGALEPEPVRSATPENADRPPAANESPSVGAAAASGSTAPRPTVAGRVWVAIGVAVIVLVLLIIFIAENSRKVTVSFLGASGSISLGLAMLIAAVAGVVITLLAGTARILQLRREVRRHRRRAQRTSR